MTIEWLGKLCGLFLQAIYKQTTSIRASHTYIYIWLEAHSPKSTFITMVTCTECASVQNHQSCQYHILFSRLLNSLSICAAITKLLLSRGLNIIFTCSRTSSLDPRRLLYPRVAIYVNMTFILLIRRVLVWVTLDILLSWSEKIKC